MNRKDKKYRGTQCLNCETQLDVSEKFCHACGQLNSTKKLTIRDFIEEFFANFYAYDSRLRNSIVSIFTNQVFWLANLTKEKDIRMQTRFVYF